MNKLFWKTYLRDVPFPAYILVLGICAVIAGIFIYQGSIQGYFMLLLIIIDPLLYYFLIYRKKT